MVGPSGSGGRADRRRSGRGLVGPGRLRHLAARPRPGRPGPDDRVPLRAGADDAFQRELVAGQGHPGGEHSGVARTEHAVRRGTVRPLPARAAAHLPRRAGHRLRTRPATTGRPGAVMPTLAVWKFASCDGCQLTLLDCEDELLSIAGEVKIAHFVEASSETQPGPYDVSLVEGSITTAADAERIRQVREMSRTLVTIGAC